MTKTLLLTGFEPFDGSSLNPSAELAKAMDDTTVGQFKIVGKVLHLDYTRALDEVRDAINQHKPSVVIACGQANRGAITFEKIAVNALNTMRGDNYENIPESDLIEKEGPPAYFTDLDVAYLAKSLRDEGIPAEVSYHAGTYGCNWLFYNLMHWRAMDQLTAQVGFIHVPPLPEQIIEKHTTTIPSMPLPMILRSMQIVIERLKFR
ncbi:MAG: pyroglutamyl-peptidase I [Candidatus Thorarchaeota archaeon]|nr:pyroglutamyl-peptidase I [Candidatus Thorarchaeota archaeon]